MNLEGQWKYQSYRPQQACRAADAVPPTMVCWSPPNLGMVTIFKGGTTGQLEFTGTPIKLALKVHSKQGHPGSVLISASMNLPGGKQFTNELHGWVLPKNPDQEASNGNQVIIQGSIVQTSADIAATNPQPPYTVGFFVLEPLQ